MTTILLDTNAYLRLAKRIRPLLGVKFNPAKQYVLIVLPDVEKEVTRNRELAFRYPWFEADDHRNERRSNTVRLSADEKRQVLKDQRFILNLSRANATDLMRLGRDPPGITDCYVLAVAMLRSWWVATDDEGMHQVGQDFDVTTIYCFEVLHKLMCAGMVDKAKVAEIYAALDANDDLTAKWTGAKANLFKAVFGKGRIKYP